ncbi:uncharacterized protein LOC120353433 isoform X2 [Nilaparvata lugens]|uniref:uncharacterized protein LOC120353433 isoform X2 n=1 Tax=Nilaparvata lugens TaxID=108931 RepID=UPI00193E5538|nr:uncharacterized protein LOC120353433 isoform X2 [Nilaparvata lugens]
MESDFSEEEDVYDSDGWKPHDEQNSSSAGVHELATSRGFMYGWDETVASRGSQEVGSCLVEHLKAQAATANHIVMYSDACTGQNRNLKLPLYLLKLIGGRSISASIIDHKFMVSGHSYLPNDRDFASVENFARGKFMYEPQCWYNVILKCRKNNTFHFKRMQCEDFESVSKLEASITRRKKNLANGQVNWLKIQWIRLLKDRPFTILYKESLNEEIPFSELNIKPAKPGRNTSLHNVDQLLLHPNGREVTKAKKMDMLSLLAYIPPIHHSFYQNLQCQDEREEQEDLGPLEVVEAEEIADA